ncbi:MAG: xanthine dehydrogenase family protein molybdopterin-binding subunit [Sphingomonas sp.]|nr:xanthine dehydrogenase family protein molybdopterin-binding subunit [Sphingomonas sp.]
MSLIPALDRRTLLIGGGIGVGLVVAFAVWPGGLASDLATASGENGFGAFIKIARNGRVTVAVPQTETGQGVWTALPQIVADELGAAWAKVGVEPAPLTAAYGNPLASDEGWLDGFGTLRTHRILDDGRSRITAGSTSVRAFEGPLRSAAAVARTMLVGAAADRWGVAPDECQTADGLVLNGGRTFSFGELAEEASSRSAPGSAPPRGDTKGRLIGRPLHRLDGPAKTNGSLRFAGDVRLPDMLFASARLAPPGGRLAGFSKAALRNVRHFETTGTWIAVVADQWTIAERALHAANPVFSAPPSAGDPRPLFEQALTSTDSDVLLKSGNFDQAAQGLRPIAATFYVAPSEHLALETVSATARWTHGSLELWSPAQAPGFVQALGAESGDVGQSATALYLMPVGEPSGRAMENPAAPIAIALAARLKRPVQVTLPHAASRNIAPLSPGAMARMSAVIDRDGFPIGWRMRLAGSDGMAATMDRLGGQSSAPVVPNFRGGMILPYGFDHVDVRAAAPKLPFATGYMRCSPQRELIFFTESFIDELARRKGQEPLALRMSLLGGNPRLAHCFQSAAQLAGWDGGGSGSEMGIAGASAFGSHIALVAFASIGSNQRVRIHKLVASVDCGRVINIGLATQQIEAGLLWAFAQSVAAAPELVGGLAKAGPMATSGLPRIGETPEIIVRFVSSTAAPGGLSGLGTLPLAPAVANALEAATGKRMRSLPFDPMGTA